MNIKRILILANKSGMEPEFLEDREIIFWLNIEDLERFAKLLVQDCAQFVEQHDPKLADLLLRTKGD